MFQVCVCVKAGVMVKRVVHLCYLHLYYSMIIILDLSHLTSIR